MASSQPAQPVTVLFFGPSGAGKGTQVRMLMEYLQRRGEGWIIHIDAGKLMRDMVASESYVGSLVKKVIESGERMPDFMPTYLTTKALIEDFTGSEHIIADGVTRGPDQTRGFDDAMVFLQRSHYQIIALELSDETAVGRMLNRGRSDDKEAFIQRRMDWYKRDTEPQLAQLAERGRTIHRIDGEPSPETVHRSVLEALELPL